MIPIPKVAKVHPRCHRCGGTERVTADDGPIAICRDCVLILVRLSGVKR